MKTLLVMILATSLNAPPSIAIQEFDSKPVCEKMARKIERELIRFDDNAKRRDFIRCITVDR